LTLSGENFDDVLPLMDGMHVYFDDALMHVPMFDECMHFVHDVAPGPVTSLSGKSPILRPFGTCTYDFMPTVFVHACQLDRREEEEKKHA
jgi:hypothetical protein